MIILLGLFACVALAFTDQLAFLRRTQDPSDTTCMVLNCGWQLAKCGFSSECRDSIACMQQCNPDDFMCTSDCFFEYSNQQFNELVGCAVEHKCVQPLTWSNHTCPKMEGRAMEFDITRFAEKGELYVARGAHTINDCMPCQRLKMKKLDNAIDVEWSTVSRSNKVRKTHYVVKGGKNIHTDYELFGMPVHEQYYILDASPCNKYFLYFYCGFGFGGEYQGAVIYSSEKGMPLPERVVKRFQEALHKANLREYIPTNLDEYCKPDYNRQCENFNE